VLPQSWARTQTPFGPTPSAVPDNALAETTFSQPRAGKVYLRAFIPHYGVDCPGGFGVVALYLDGVAVPDSGVNASLVSQARALESVAVVTSAAGTHTLSIGNDCVNGPQTNSVIAGFGSTFTALSVGE
jgi:hypothetical protein